MHEAYINLLGAIYKMAVDDDLNGASEKSIDKFLKDNKENIKNEVRKNVYEESRNFGGDTRRIQEANIRKLVEKIASDFKNQSLGVK